MERESSPREVFSVGSPPNDMEIRHHTLRFLVLSSVQTIHSVPSSSSIGPRSAHSSPIFQSGRRRAGPTMAKSAGEARRAASLAVTLAIMTIFMGARRASAGDPVHVARPQPTKVTPASGPGAGKEVVGTIERWDDAAVHGTFGGSAIELRWDELAPNDAYRIRKRLIEAVDAPADRRGRFLELATYLWSIDGADRLAVRAADDAKRLGADAAALAEARTDAATVKSERAARLEAAARHALRTGSPEADPAVINAPATPWPVLTIEQQRECQAWLRKETGSRLASSGREVVPVESTQALVFSEIGVPDAALRATEIDDFVARSLPRLGLPKESVVWWGKLVVVILEDHDRFALYEASAFRHKVGTADVALTHFDGPRVFVTVLKQSDPVATRTETARAVARALLYRHRTSAHLPMWLHEGLTDWLVSVDPPTKSLDTPLRKPGLAFIRSDGALAGVVEANYTAGEPPFGDAADRPRVAAFALVSYLAEQHPKETIALIDALKLDPGDIAQWKLVFERVFARSLEQMLITIRAYYQMND